MQVSTFFSLDLLDVDPVQHHRQLGCIDHHGPSARRPSRELKPTHLKPFEENDESPPRPCQRLDVRHPLRQEDEHMSAVHVQSVGFDPARECIEALADVDGLGGHVDACRRRHVQHRPNSVTNCATQAAGGSLSKTKATRSSTTSRVDPMSLMDASGGLTTGTTSRNVGAGDEDGVVRANAPDPTLRALLHRARQTPEQNRASPRCPSSDAPQPGIRQVRPAGSLGPSRP